ncbi:hypothetical protein N9H74_06250 [Hyphomicrobiales bacterium]|nr:hypothetical protein [Hyphomicrobiales bacterium]
MTKDKSDSVSENGLKVRVKRSEGDKEYTKWEREMLVHTRIQTNLLAQIDMRLMGDEVDDFDKQSNWEMIRRKVGDIDLGMRNDNTSLEDQSDEIKDWFDPETERLF